MATDELYQSEDVPTLSTVVKVGDESLIQTRRIGVDIANELDSNLGTALSREIFAALSVQTTDTMTISTKDKPVDALAPEISGELLAELTAQPAPSECNQAEQDFEADTDETLELLIDDIVDRHITALRKDIRQLLEHAIAER